MMLLRLLNPQGIAGLAAVVCLSLLLLAQKVETRHWKKQSAQFEQLHRRGEAERATMVADFAAAAETARAADRANAARVAAAQDNISRSSQNDFTDRITRARAVARRLRENAPAADHGAGRGTDLPRLPAAPGGPAQVPGTDRLSDAERLAATEQAIQLDELIKWVRGQAALDPNRSR